MNALKRMLGNVHSAAHAEDAPCSKAASRSLTFK
jgi:hypothetical protein